MSQANNTMKYKVVSGSKPTQQQIVLLPASDGAYRAHLLLYYPMEADYSRQEGKQKQAHSFQPSSSVLLPASPNKPVNPRTPERFPAEKQNMVQETPMRSSVGIPSPVKPPSMNLSPIKPCGAKGSGVKPPAVKPSHTESHRNSPIRSSPRNKVSHTASSEASKASKAIRKVKSPSRKSVAVGKRLSRQLEIIEID